MLENPFTKILVKKAAGDYVPFTNNSVKDPYNQHWTQDVGNWVRDVDRHANDYALESVPASMDWLARIPYLKHVTQYIPAAAAPVLNMLQGRGPFANWSDKDAYENKAYSDRKRSVDDLYDSSSSGWSDDAADKWKWDYTTMLDPRFRSVKDIVSILDSDPKYKAALETVAKTGNLDDLRSYYTESGKPNAVEDIWNSKYNIGDNAQGNAQLLFNLYNSAKSPKQTAPVATPIAAPALAPATDPIRASSTNASTASEETSAVENNTAITSPFTLSNADPFADVRNQLGIAKNPIGKDIGYEYTTTKIPEFLGGSGPLASTATPTPTPAPKTVQTKKPTGLTREETMQFLEQGYVPTSVGGYALNEQKAADTLRAMRQNPNLNPGTVITDADRLNRIRTTMLGNEQHTAQGRQLEADMAALNDYEYHQKHRAQQNAVPDAQATAYGNNVYNDIHDGIMRKGKNQAMRRVGGGEAYAGEAADRQRLGLPANTPITPEEQYYNKYIEAENNGTALPKLPDVYNRQYNRQLAQYRGQLRQSSPAQTNVRPKHPNYMTGQEMNDYIASQRGNIVENNWKSLSPERQAAARQARAARQAARSNGVPQQTAVPNPIAAKQPATTNSLNKTASIRKSLINPFLR